MTWFTLTLTARQPVSLGRSGARGYLTPTYPYVPGSVVRGALATAWLNATGASTTDERFLRLFEGSARFGPAMPDGLALVPQSVRRCKYHRADSGHAAAYDDAFPHGEATVDPASPDLPRLPAPCGAWERASGEPTWHLVRAVTSTAIEPGTLHVAESQLYSRQTLPAGTVFTGHLVAPDGLDATLTGLTRAYVGGKSSVMGEVEVRITSCDRPALPDGEWGLVTRTPTILVDEAGRPTLDPTYALRLAGYTGELRHWGRRTQIEGTGGWHAASGLPKPSEITVGPGLVLRLPGAGPDEAAALLDHGLGLRRQEGFGWLAPTSRWSANSATTTERASDRSPLSAHMAKVEMLHPGSDPARWVADRMRTIPYGSPTQVDAALHEPRVEGLPTETRTMMRELLLKIPPDLRAAVAARLEGGVR